MKRGKHRHDHNHGKNGRIGGNARYNRAKGGRRMGRVRNSSTWKGN